MAKGDAVAVTVAVGGTARISEVVATKIGRTVHVTYGPKWITVEEMSRPTSVNKAGLPTGNRLKVATSALVSVLETRRTDEDV